MKTKVKTLLNKLKELESLNKEIDKYAWEHETNDFWYDITDATAGVNDAIDILEDLLSN